MDRTTTMIHQGPSSKQPAPGRSIQDNISSATLQRAAVPAQLQITEAEDMNPVQGKLQSAGQPGPFILQQQPQEARSIPERFTLPEGSTPIQRKLINKDFPELTDSGKYGKNQEIGVYNLPQKVIDYPLNLYKTTIEATDSYEKLVRLEAEKIAEIGEMASSDAIKPVAEQTDKNPEYSQEEENPLAITGGGGRGLSGRSTAKKSTKSKKSKVVKKGSINVPDNEPAARIMVGYKTRDRNHYWPFALRLEGTWEEKKKEEKKEEKGIKEDTGGTRNIEVTFSNSGYGYTQKVEGDENAEYIASDEIGEGFFPMKHDYNEDGTINISARAKALANSNDADATSKVISEGARWISVRKKAAEGNLKDTTRFYPDGYYSPNSIVPSVSFKELWNSWAGLFNKEWNISEEVLINKLEKGELKSATSPVYGALEGEPSNYAIPRATLLEKDDINKFLEGPLAGIWNSRDKGEVREDRERGNKGIRIGVSSTEHDNDDEEDEGNQLEGGTKLDNYGRSVNIFKDKDEHAQDPANFFYTLTHELALHAIPHQLDEEATHILDHDAIIDYDRGYFVNVVRPAAQSLFDNENADEARNPNFPTCDSFLAEFLIDIDTSVRAFRGNYISEILERDASPDPDDQYQTPQNIAALKTLVEKAWSTMVLVIAFRDFLEVAMPKVDEEVAQLKEMFTPILDLSNDEDDETVLSAIAYDIRPPKTVTTEEEVSDEGENNDDESAFLSSAFASGRNRFTASDDDGYGSDG